MIEAQLALEREMVEHGKARYHRITSEAEGAGRGSETSYACRLLPELVQELAEAIEEAKTSTKPGRRSSYLKLLAGCDSAQAAFITLKLVFDALIRGDAVTSIAIGIGTRIEDQIRFSLFEMEYEAYYQRVIEDFRRKNTTSYRHKHRVLTHKAGEKEDGWVAWTPQERLHLGVKLLELCIETTGIIKKVISTDGTVYNCGTRPKRGKVVQRVARIEATEETLKWIAEHSAQAEMLHPDCTPCIIPPNDWVSLQDGGYYTPELRRRIPFVKISPRLIGMH